MTSTTSSPTSEIKAIQKVVCRIGNSSQMSLFAALIALVLVFSLIIGEKFLSGQNFRSMALQLPEVGILSLAMMVTLLHGGVNLSIVATANLTGITIGWLMTTYLPGTEGAVWWIYFTAFIVVGLVAALIVGLVNGAIIAYLGVSPILVTLGTMILIRGLSIGLTKGTVISGFSEPIQFLGSGLVFGVPLALIVFLVIALIFGIIINRTAFGHSVYFMGSNERATAFSGIDTRRVLVKIYVLSSLLAGIAGLLMMARFNSTNASYGEAYLLITILAAVLGGIDPYGGVGRVGGLLISLLILQVISSAFNQMGFLPFLTLAIWGATLILVSAISGLRLHRRRS